MPPHRHVALLGRSAWRHLAAVSLASGTLAAQAPNRSASDSLDSLIRTAEAHHFRGALGEAHAALATADSMAMRRSEPTALARVWVTWAGIWISQTTATNAGYLEADSSAARALRYAEQARDPGLIAHATDLRGRALYSRKINLDEGDYDGPLAHFNRALELRKAAGDTGGVVESMFRVGLIHERKDESEQAVAIYEAAMRLAGDAYPLERSNLARHLAYQRQAQGDLDAALKWFLESLELRDRAGFKLTRPSALTSIADVYRHKGDYDRALAYGRRAMEEAERLGASRFVVGALISLGQTYGAAGDGSRALEQLRRADSLAASIGYVSGVQRARAEQSKLTGADAGRY
jgi:tetratricopeptide (TPR) repeat protein